MLSHNAEDKMVCTLEILKKIPIWYRSHKYIQAGRQADSSSIISVLWQHEWNQYIGCHTESEQNRRKKDAAAAVKLCVCRDSCTLNWIGVGVSCVRRMTEIWVYMKPLNVESRCNGMKTRWLKCAEGCGFENSSNNAKESERWRMTHTRTHAHTVKHVNQQREREKKHVSSCEMRFYHAIFECNAIWAI